LLILSNNLLIISIIIIFLFFWVKLPYKKFFLENVWKMYGKSYKRYSTAQMYGKSYKRYGIIPELRIFPDCEFPEKLTKGTE